MRTFSIAQMEKLSGTKKHTIRIWEKRHHLLNPRRINGNRREYLPDDFERLMYASFLNQAGLKVSKLSRMDNLQLKDFSAKLYDRDKSNRYYTIQLILSLYKAQIEQFELLLDKIFTSIGISLAVHNVVVPFLTLTGLVTYTGDAAEIHFAVTSIRKKLLVAIDQVSVQDKIDKKALLYLPKGQHFDLILLFISFTLKCQGYTIYYMGTNVSEETLQNVLASLVPDNLYVYTVHPNSSDVQNMSNFIKDNFPYIHFTIVTDSCQLNSPNGNLAHYLSFCNTKQANY